MTHSEDIIVTSLINKNVSLYEYNLNNCSDLQHLKLACLVMIHALIFAFWVILVLHCLSNAKIIHF